MTFDSKNKEWLIQSTEEMSKHLRESMQSKPVVTIIVKDSQSNKQDVVIPVTPPQTEDSGYTDYDESDYSPTQPIEPTPTPSPTPQPTPRPTPVPPVDDSDYGDSDYEVSDYDDSSYDEDSPYDDDSSYDDSSDDQDDDDRSDFSDYELDDSDFDD